MSKMKSKDQETTSAEELAKQNQDDTPQSSSAEESTNILEFETSQTKGAEERPKLTRAQKDSATAQLLLARVMMITSGSELELKMAEDFRLFLLELSEMVQEDADGAVLSGMSAEVLDGGEKVRLLSFCCEEDAEDWRQHRDFAKRLRLASGESDNEDALTEIVVDHSFCDQARTLLRSQNGGKPVGSEILLKEALKMQRVAS